MESLTVNGKNYIKASVAARDLGYTADYVGQLCRSGKVDAMLVGRSWYVSKDSIKGHKSTRYRSTQTKSRESIKQILVSEHSPLSQRDVPKAAYDRDESELFPVVRKTGVLDVELADALPVKITSQTQKYDFKTTELPRIQFRGSLRVTDIEDTDTEDAALEEAHVIHPTSVRDTSKKAKNIDISDVPVRIIQTEVSMKKRTVLSNDQSDRHGESTTVVRTQEVVAVERSVFTPVVSFVSFALASLIVLCVLGLELHVSATSESLTTSYQFDIDHLTASAYASIEHSQNFLYLVEFSTNVLIF